MKAQMDKIKTQTTAQIDMLKEQFKAGNEQAGRDLKIWQTQIQDDFDRDKMAIDSGLEEFDLENKHQVEMDKAATMAEVSKQREYPNAPNGSGT
jgi:hypothetical protein